MIFLLQRRSRRAPGRASLPSCGLKPSVSSRHTLWRQNKCQITTDAVQVHAILSATSATLLLAASCKGDFQLTTRATPHGCKPWCFGLQQHLKKQPLTLLLHLDLRCAGGASVMSVVCSKQNTVSHADSLHKALQSQTAPGNIMHLQCATTSYFWCKTKSQEGSGCHACCSLQGEWQHSQGARFASKQGRACSSKACHSKEGAVVPHAMTTACLLS